MAAVSSADQGTSVGLRGAADALGWEMAGDAVRSEQVIDRPVAASTTGVTLATRLAPVRAAEAYCLQ